MIDRESVFNLIVFFFLSSPVFALLFVGNPLVRGLAYLLLFVQSSMLVILLRYVFRHNLEEVIEDSFKDLGDIFKDLFRREK